MKKHLELMEQATDLISMEELPANALALFDEIYAKAEEVTKTCLDDLRNALLQEMDEQGLMEETPEAQAAEIEAAATQAATSVDNDLPEPTEAQKLAGNYKKAKVVINGLTIIIENPKNSTRSGKSPSGVDWSSTLTAHYGDIAGTTGADGDKLDVFVGDAVLAQSVYIVDQIEPETGKFDEHKVMMCFDNEDQARAAYLNNYEEDWSGLAAITTMTFEEFKEWAIDPVATTKPLSSDLLLSSVQEEEPSETEPAEKAAENEPEKLAGSVEEGTVIVEGEEVFTSESEEDQPEQGDDNPEQEPEPAPLEE